MSADKAAGCCRRGGRDAACGASEEAHAETLLQAAHSVTQRGLRHAQPFGGSRQAALVCDGQKGLEDVEVVSHHS
jgi:hypothetical protein